jgi:hypothetical protein
VAIVLNGKMPVRVHPNAHAAGHKQVLVDAFGEDLTPAEGLKQPAFGWNGRVKGAQQGVFHAGCKYACFLDFLN